MSLATRVRPDSSLTASELERLVFERGFPLTTDSTTTFAYEGEADSVRLVHFGIGLPDDLHFERVAGSDWWLLSLELPYAARLEYQLDVVEHGQHRVIEDPLNPIEARNPFGQNSVCRSYGYSVPPWALHDPAAPPGRQRALAFHSDALHGSVPTTLYLPASFTFSPERPYPLLILHDGIDYLHYAAAATVLDNLIHRALIPEFVVAFCAPRDRLREYADDERHARFVAEELVPYLEAHLPLIGQRDARYLGGASFGALATLSTAIRYPDVFGRLMFQSGSFAGASAECIEPVDDLWRPVYDFVRRYVDAPTKVADRIHMSCGVLEPMISENRAIRPVFVRAGMDVEMSEAVDGHTWGCWRDQLGVALQWLFAGVRPPVDPAEGAGPGGAERPASFRAEFGKDGHG